MAFGAKCGRPSIPGLGIRDPGLEDKRPRALGEQVALQQLRQSRHADAKTRLPEKAPPVHNYSFITTSFRLRMRLVTLVYAASSLTFNFASR